MRAAEAEKHSSAGYLCRTPLPWFGTEIGYDLAASGKGNNGPPKDHKGRGITPHALKDR